MALISRRAISAGVATAIAASALAALPARADDNRPVPTITTNGEGNVDVAPDIAILGLGVVREADTARAALDAGVKPLDAEGAALAAANDDDDEGGSP